MHPNIKKNQKRLLPAGDDRGAARPVRTREGENCTRTTGMAARAGGTRNQGGGGAWGEHPKREQRLLRQRGTGGSKRGKTHQTTGLRDDEGPASRGTPPLNAVPHFRTKKT